MAKTRSKAKPVLPPDADADAEASAADGDLPSFLAKYFERREPVSHGPVLGPECFGPSDRPAAHQEDVRQLVAALAASKRGARRGLLVWHSTGTVKTGTAAIALNAFWGTKRPLVYVTTAAALALGPMAKLQRYAAQKLGAAPDAYARRGVRAMSYEELRDGFNDLGQAVLVVDEAHNLLNSRFLALQRRLLAAPADLTLVALTATPGPFPEATLVLLNLLRPAGRPLYALPKTDRERAAMGARLRKERLIAYYDAVEDAAHFPTVRVTDSTGGPAGAKVAQMVDDVAAAPGDRHMVWAPDADVAAAAAEGLTAAGVRFVQLRGDVTAVAREFNQGQAPGVMLVANRQLGEAVDLRGVRHVHVLDQALDADGLKQVVGRAYRYCSHAFLPEQDWTVDVTLYLPRVPGRVDARITRLEDVASQARGAMVMLVGLADEVARQAGVDVTDVIDGPTVAVDKAVRDGLRKLPAEEAASALKVWADLPKLRREVDRLSKQLAQEDLRVLASVHEAEARLTSDQHASDATNQSFYDVLRGSSSGGKK